MTHLHLEGMALRQHDRPYPFDYRPYMHQLELRRLVHQTEGCLAVNDSPTGGGKTASWLVPALEGQLETMAIYPTNALVVDQATQIAADVQTFDHAVSTMAVTGGRLADLTREWGLNSNGEALERWYRHERLRHDQVVMLTNPDVFIMCCRDLYRRPSRAYKQFPLVVVDEFHRANRKEQNTLCYLLDELYESDHHALESIVCLSATPDETRERTFEEAMRAPYHRIGGDGDRERRAFSGDLEEPWHAVMPPVTLDVRAAPTFGTVDVLMERDAESTLEFCRQGRVALILDGIHEVARVSRWLDRTLDRRVERIDGFRGQNKAEKLRRFEVLVSNSAVEVGIDFELDRLIFAGHDRASFLQRLGRLRTRETRCRARCYLPPSVADRWASYEGEEWSRRELDDELTRAYPEPRSVSNIDCRYSAPEALEHLEDRLRHVTSDRRASLVRTAGARIERHFLADADLSFADDTLREAKEQIDWRLLRTLQWYRGDSLQVLVYDRCLETLRTYRLFYLLRYGDVTFLRPETFKQEVPSDHHESINRHLQYMDGCCLYDGTIETSDEGGGRRVALTGGRLAGWLRSKPRDIERRPHMLPGLEVHVQAGDDQPRLPSIEILNERLRHRREHAPGEAGGILCYPVTGRAPLVEARYDLGSFFVLHPVALDLDTDYSLALGADALFLHCHVLNHYCDDTQT